MATFNQILEEMNAYGERFGEPVHEAQKTQAHMSLDPKAKPKKPGSFKVNVKDLRKLLGQHGKGLEHQVLGGFNAINSIPREDMPVVFGKDNIPDAQDEIAWHPRKAFQMWLRNIHKLSPKIGKHIRKHPDVSSLLFYGYMLRLSGREMADIIMNRYFSERDYYEPSEKVKAKQKRRRQAASMPSGRQTKMFPESVESIIKTMQTEAGIIDEAKSPVYGELKKELEAIGFKHRKIGKVDVYTRKAPNKEVAVKHLVDLFKRLGIEGYHNVEKFQGGVNWHFAHKRNRNIKVTVTAYDDTPELVVNVY